MDLLLPEQQRGAALAHALAARAEDAVIELDAAVEIGDGDVQMIDAFDFHGVLPEIAGVPDRTTPQISSNGEEPQPSSPAEADTASRGRRFLNPD